MLVNLKGAAPHTLVKTNGTVVCLVPGVNRISKEDWEEFSKHPDIKEMISNEDGKIQVVKEAKEIPPENKDEDVHPDLAKMSVKEAVKVVEQCLNKELLNEWKSHEGRKAVLNVIEKQLDKLVIKKAE